jgi:uncharacterized tellurite resistance protein B-like protein
MYASVRSFLEPLGSADHPVIEFSTSDSRVALAVLLFRMVKIDGKIRESEMCRYRQLLQDCLDVTPDELALFETMVQKESERDKSLTPFISVANRMSAEKRRRIVAMMQEISLSDAELHEFEINLMTRTAQLLNISLK